MKRFFYVLSLLILTAGIASSQNVQKKKKSFAVVGYDTHDFGKIKKTDGPVTHIFKIKNEGDSSLAILTAKASCSCTTVTHSKEPIAPGSDNGEVKVTFNPEHHKFLTIKTISVYDNERKDPLKLFIKAEIIE